MRIRSRLLTKLGGWAIFAAIRRWMSTLEYQVACYDPSVDVVHPDYRGPGIFLLWHEYIPFPFYLRGHCNFAMLLSQHQDAEWLSQAAKLMGFSTVRGSTNRGGIAALRELFRKSHSMNLAMTPDGPRGPRRVLALGPVFLASRLGLPLIVTGFGYDRPWRSRRSWDHFAIPRPFSRARAIISPPIHVPSHLDREGLEEVRAAVEKLLNRLTSEAERWAESGARMDGQAPMLREAVPWWRYRAAA